MGCGVSEASGFVVCRTSRWSDALALGGSETTCVAMVDVSLSLVSLHDPKRVSCDALPSIVRVSTASSARRSVDSHPPLAPAATMRFDAGETRFRSLQSARCRGNSERSVWFTTTLFSYLKLANTSITPRNLVACSEACSEADASSASAVALKLSTYCCKKCAVWLACVAKMTWSNGPCRRDSSSRSSQNVRSVELDEACRDIEGAVSCCGLEGQWWTTSIQALAACE